MERIRSGEGSKKVLVIDADTEREMAEKVHIYMYVLHVHALGPSYIHVLLA